MKKQNNKPFFFVMRVLILVMVFMSGILLGGQWGKQSNVYEKHNMDVKQVSWKLDALLESLDLTLDESEDEKNTIDAKDLKIKEDGTYTSKEEVAEYIHLYEKLPSNFITKKEAQELGWNNRDGNLDEVAPGKSIGGDKFGNYEELLPVKKGRKYFECDIDYEGGFRGAKRIIFSDDGLVYYTEDHYKTFEQIY